ncbi:isocitrate lyase/phosphoenolpyruvate mutase family protein [Actinocatenispora sera]|uniref:Carboxyvinyl-carboxyphosphonate phosphorylmutase n=1 Tax=Actinocatenispora sera TaxID=390989 RepID=A0A810KVT0_9ACTN|nr:isocitrate lyase/phosphoenolpyruvate mutase family protein [Actinocatenispora sera]BCJ27154.1 carboxyvinyl-carboxyphosphonate phosphorylmutase [Actinocatenispora sera]
MTASALADAAATFRALHRPGTPVVLPNAWDANSARIVAEQGFPAVATSSVAVAESLGYSDGGGAPPELMFAAAGRIARAVDLPVTVDAENGYGLPAADLVAALVSAGAVGANIEDSTGGVLSDVDTHAARLAGVREAAVAAGVPLVLNARVDVFLRSPGLSEAERVDAAIARANRYLAAGADCVYPILCPPTAVARLVNGIDGPVNVHWRPDGPSPAEFAALGVARISAGGLLWRMAMDAYRNAVGTLSM